LSSANDLETVIYTECGVIGVVVRSGMIAAMARSSPCVVRSWFREFGGGGRFYMRAGSRHGLTMATGSITAGEALLPRVIL
jgi:hypothetical protein